MRMYLNIEESTELRQFTHDLIKSQVKHIVRNELNAILKDQLAEQIKAVADSLDGKIREDVARYLHGYYVNRELHKMVTEFINTQLKAELSNVLSTVKDNIVSICLQNIVTDKAQGKGDIK